LPPANDCRHDIGKLSCGLKPRATGLAAASNNRRCNRNSKPFVPISLQYLRYFLFRRLIEPLPRRHATRRIHAHVQWAVLQEAESARRIVDLRRGDAEIEEKAVDAGDASLVEDPLELREAGLHQLEPVVLPRSLEQAAGRDRIRIAVEREQAAARTECVENAPAVTAAPERAIDIGAVRAQPQRGHRLGSEHRDVRSIVGPLTWRHPRQKPSASRRASGMPASACSSR
jgi:hypothetical protein